MNRVITLCCIVVTGGALALTAMNFLNNPVEAKRLELQEQLRDLPAVAPSAATVEAFEWPFAEWQSTIKSKPKVWQRLIPEIRYAPKTVAVAKAPAWPALLKGVTASRREMGGKPKILHPGKPKGEYIPIGAKLNGCVLESFDRRQVTFSHYWPPTKETRTFSIPRE